jgi:GNAT superfamily N-acetyltransferase
MALDRLSRQAHVVEDAWAAAWASLGALGAQPRTVVDDMPDCLRVYTPGAPDMLLNLVMRYSSSGPITEDDIEQVIAPYRRHRLPFQWWLTQGLEPKGLRERLQALGMQSWGGSTSMTLDFAGWQPDYPAARGDVRLTRVASAEDARDALRVICDVFFLPWEATARWTVDNPAFHTYLARLGKHPVAAMTTMSANGVVLLFNVATIPAARRRGIAGNLVLLALRDALAEGCTQAALTATPEARRLYEELGFTSCAFMEQWIPTYRLNRTLTHGERPDYDFGYDLDA